MLPTRAVAEALSPDPLQPPDPWKPCSWTFAHAGRNFWVKDIRRTKPLFRATIGRMALGREARIYRRMAGLSFVPRFAGRFDRHSLVFEKLEGVRPLNTIRDGDELPADYFDKVAAAVRELHRRGILHLDLRHRSNLLLGPGGEPYLVDFESALCLGRGFPSLGFLVPLLAWADRSAILKFRARYHPDRLSPEEQRRHRRFSRLRRLWPFGRIWPPRSRRRREEPVKDGDG